MEYRKFGDKDFKVSTMGFGASPFGDIFGYTDINEIKNTVASAIDAGVNYYDVAPSYGPEGRAEERLGVALEGHRKKIFLATKCGKYDHGTAEHADVEFDYSYDRVIREVEESLRRLRTDYIDVYQVHEINKCDFNVLMEETLPAMEKLRQDGKIRYIGLTNIGLPLLKKAIEQSPVKIDSVISFCRYDLINTTLQGYFGSLLKDRGIALINAAVLHLGLLTPNNKTLFGFRDDPNLATLRNTIQKAHELCAEYGENLSDQGVKFAFQYDEPCMTLMGMGRMRSLTRNLDSIGKKPNEELVKKLIALFKTVDDPLSRDD